MDMLIHVKQRLHNYPQVVGVGFGWKEIQGEVTVVPAMRVYVTEKIPRTKLHHADIIPNSIAGIPTDVLLEKAGSSVSAANSDFFSTLRASAKVSNLKGVLGNGAIEGEGSGLGTLGFFAALNGSAPGQHLVLVSNRHDMLAQGAQKGDLIYQPRYTQREGRCYFQSDALNPVAEILDEGFEGNYTYNYPGEAATEYFIDCATARLLTRDAVTVRSEANSDGKHFTSIARAHALDWIRLPAASCACAKQGKENYRAVRLAGLWT
jgi:hypothetical protein